jgi:hypothetical protein
MWMDRINIYDSKKLPDEIDIKEILEDIREILPSHFLRNIESIYVGDFDALKDRDMDALYENGAIYIRPDSVVNAEDLLDDIIHEIAHSLEESYAIDIYGDGRVEREFIIKRNQLFNKLKGEENTYFPRDYFLNTDYSKEFDEFLYKTVGYPLLTSLTVDIFPSPYGATSLREYFANAFEKYFMEESERVREISPQVYKKIEELINQEEDEDYGSF